jgi:phosphoglycerol transferase MdoB-like AlkP superfamily enzyme
MKERIKFILLYFVFWLLIFMAGKIGFLLYEHTQSFELPVSDWFRILWHGFRLDLSAAGYITLLPVLVVAFTSFSRGRIPWLMVNAYFFLILPVFLLISFIDLEIYKYWGTRLDITPLRFLSTPGETLASSTFITIVIYLSAFGLLTWFLIRIYLRYIANWLIESPAPRLWGMILFITLAGLLFLPIRGGIGVSAINTGSAYFHKNDFANHAAVNVLWNFGQSVMEDEGAGNPFLFDNNPDYASGIQKLYADTGAAATLLSNQRPRILLIIMESFSAKIIGPLGGIKGLTPNFNELCRNGILFSNVYSTDSRTDKGLATVISGFPVLYAIPILRHTHKTQHLPFLSNSLINNGYHASFYYGGNVNFANMRAYLVNGNFSKIISDVDFPASQRTGKWGAPDNVVFTRFLEEIKADTGLSFSVILTLSNHEPYEIQNNAKFGNKNLTERFYSAASYADSCLGDFIRKYKEAGKWDNSLVIMVADHGTRPPDYSQYYEPRKFHIPLLITGGVIEKDTVVTKVGSQADVAKTLLHQLGIDTREYFLGKDLLSPESHSFTFYSYKNGIAMLTDTCGFGLNFENNSFTFSFGPVDKELPGLAKSYQQFVYDHYLSLSQKITR